jgi:hypothetical protein
MSQKVCGSPECAQAFAEKERSKKERKEYRARKAVIMAIPKLKARAVYYCHRYIRLRDGHVCISCGTTTAEEWHAGHYIAGTNSPTKFDQFNINVQCSRCNTHLRGNLIPYRKNLIEKYGITTVERLEALKGTVKWSREVLEDVIDMYKRMYDSELKGLKNGNG